MQGRHCLAVCNVKLQSFRELTPAALNSLAASLRDGPLSLGVSHLALGQIVGNKLEAVARDLDELSADDFSPPQMGILLQAVLDSRTQTGSLSEFIEVVMSGPDVPGIPTADTAATLMSIVQDASEEILLVGYAVHKGRRVFECIANRMMTVPTLRVRFCLDISRKPSDTSLDSEIVRRFAFDFRTKHWPWSKYPELFYDPRSLAAAGPKRSSLHAKCVIIDHRIAFVTSANFTEAAQERNIEVGVLIRQESVADKIANYFNALCVRGQLVRAEII